jgi:hypothetical protein
MPDMERLFRSLELHLEKDPQKREVISAYHAGLDRARKEIALISLALAAVVVLGAWLVG